MIRLEFQEDIKMLTIVTDNIFDQNHFIYLIRTSLCNSRKVETQSGLLVKG